MGKVAKPSRCSVDPLGGLAAQALVEFAPVQDPAHRAQAQTGSGGDVGKFGGNGGELGTGHEVTLKRARDPDKYLDDESMKILC